MSRRRRTAIVALCLASAAILVWLDHAPPVHTPAPEDPNEQAAKDFEKYHRNTFRVAGVVDGDTIDIDVPDAEHEHTRIRLLGIDAPESYSENGEPAYFGPQASQFAKNLLREKHVTIYLDKPENTRGYYGRLLAYVQLPDNTLLNEVLINQGYAYADLRFKHSNYNRYKQLDSVARAQSKGLWAEVTRNQLPEWLQRKKPTLLQTK